MFENSLPPAALIFDMIGIAGFAVYVTNYVLLTFHKLHSHDTAYFALNLLAATLVLIGLMASFNLASAMIQIFWVFISLAAITLRKRRKSGALSSRAAPHGAVFRSVHQRAA